MGGGRHRLFSSSSNKGNTTPASSHPISPSRMDSVGSSIMTCSSNSSSSTRNSRFSFSSSSAVSNSTPSQSTKSSYRIMILGAPEVGKSSIISQFLYDTFSEVHKPSMDEMYQGEFEITSNHMFSTNTTGGPSTCRSPAPTVPVNQHKNSGRSSSCNTSTSTSSSSVNHKITFDVQDVSGTYIYEFPSMRDVSINAADAFIIVFDLSELSTWDEVVRIRNMIAEVRTTKFAIQAKDYVQPPIVIVGNKFDLKRDVFKTCGEGGRASKASNEFNECGTSGEQYKKRNESSITYETMEPIAVFDWECGYVESSAKWRHNINKIFKELLIQAGLPHFLSNETTTGSFESSHRRFSFLPAPRKFSHANNNIFHQQQQHSSSNLVCRKQSQSVVELDTITRRCSTPSQPATFFNNETYQRRNTSSVCPAVSSERSRRKSSSVKPSSGTARRRSRANSFNDCNIMASDGVLPNNNTCLEDNNRSSVAGEHGSFYRRASRIAHWLRGTSNTTNTNRMSISPPNSFDIPEDEVVSSNPCVTNGVDDDVDASMSANVTNKSNGYGRKHGVLYGLTRKTSNSVKINGTTTKEKVGRRWSESLARKPSCKVS